MVAGSDKIGQFCSWKTCKSEKFPLINVQPFYSKQYADEYMRVKLSYNYSPHKRIYNYTLCTKRLSIVYNNRIAEQQ